MARRKERPISIIPFQINNLGDFLGDETYPVLHPLSSEYNTYWDDRTAECIYGLWGDDSRMIGQKKVGGFRWLPGNILFHTHHCIIDRTLPGQRSKGPGRPDLRDVEWFVGYDLAACDGFAGFEDDKKYTCFRPVGKLERGEQLTHAEQIQMDKFGDIIRDKFGKLKKYADAREYLYQPKDEILGKPLWLNESQNYLLVSTRRLGKTSIVINAISVYNFCFNGARTLDEFYNQSTRTTTVVMSGVSDKTKEYFAKWNQTYDHLRTQVGAYNDGVKNYTGAWWWKFDGTVAKENGFITNGVKARGQDGLTGPGSRLWHQSAGKSASKAAGTSLNDGIIEEFGLTPGCEDIFAENSPAQRADYFFGKTTGIGTGGDFAIIEGNKSLVLNPTAYRILACKNPFTPGGHDTARFIPATYYQDQYRNENGNQDVKRAFEDLMRERADMEMKDTKQYLRHKASYPLHPDEIFLKFDGNDFPIVHLENRYEELKEGKVPYSTGRIAYSDILNTKAYWIEDLTLKPIMDLEDLTQDEQVTNFDKRGCFVQYETPNEDRPARKINDRNPLYLLFVEPVRNEKGTSFFYAYVWKFFDYKHPDRIQNNIVMEWFGRYDNNNEANLLRCFQMAALYDCNIFPEVNNDAIVGVARKIGKTDWLMAELSHIPGLEVQNKKSHLYGFYVAPGMNPGLEKLTNELLRTEVSFTERIHGSEYVREAVILADTLNSRMLVSQLIDYNSESGNYDAYDGFRLLPVWLKGTEKKEDQFANPESDRKLFNALKEMQKHRIYSRRVNSPIGRR